MNSPTALNFTENILKYSFGGSMLNSTSGEIYGAGTRFNIPRTINEQTYAVPAPDCLTPVAPAYSAFAIREIIVPALPTKVLIVPSF